MKILLFITISLLCLTINAQMDTFSNSNNKIGLVDTKGKIIVSAKYDFIINLKIYHNSSQNSSYYKFRNKKLYGIINNQGEIVLDSIKNDNLNYIGNNIVMIKYGMHIDFYNLITKKTIYTQSRGTLFWPKKGIKPYGNYIKLDTTYISGNIKKTKAAFFDNNGDFLPYNPKNEDVFINNNILIFKNGSKKVSLITGKIIDETELLEIEETFNAEEEIITENKRKGISKSEIDKIFSKKSDLRIQRLLYFNNKILGIVVERNGYLGLLSKKAKWLLPLKYDTMELNNQLTDAYILTKESNNIGIYNLNLKKKLFSKNMKEIKLINTGWEKYFRLTSTNGYSGKISKEGLVFMPKECLCY